MRFWVFGNKHHKGLHIFLALTAETGFLNLKQKISPLSVSKKHRRLCRKLRRIEWYLSRTSLLSIDFLLKVPKCEIFHLFDFNDFYGIKSV